jgi:hypothetical protein
LEEEVEENNIYKHVQKSLESNKKNKVLYDRIIKNILEEMKLQNNKYKEDNKKESYIADYIEDKIENVNEGRIERNKLYDDFYNWCMENNVKYNKIPYGSFSKILNKECKIKSVKSNNITYYINIKYKYKI